MNQAMRKSYQSQAITFHRNLEASRLEALSAYTYVEVCTLVSSPRVLCDAAGHAALQWCEGMHMCAKSTYTKV